MELAMNTYFGNPSKWSSLILILCAAVLGGVNSQATGYRCYTCSINSGSSQDQACITNPSQAGGTTSVPCDQEDGSGFGWCFIQRQEYNDMPGQAVSFVRNCLKKEPAILDDVIVDSQFTTYIRTCRSHLCNTGDGTEPLDSSNDVVSGPGGGRKPIIVHAESSALPLFILPSVLTVLFSFAFLFIQL